MRLAYVSTAASTPRGCDAERVTCSQIAALDQILPKGSLNDRGEWRWSFLVSDISFHRISEVVRNGHGCAFHCLTILAPIGEPGAQCAFFTQTAASTPLPADQAPGICGHSLLRRRRNRCAPLLPWWKAILWPSNRQQETNAATGCCATDETHRRPASARTSHALP